MQGDARCLPLQDASVDLVVTSPPYFALRSYQDGGEHYAGQIGSEATPQEFLDALWACTAEWMRVLKPSGSLWVNLGDKYSGAQAQNIGGVNRAGDSARTWAQTNPKRTGIPSKSLMGLPWRYALGCIDQLGLILRAEVIWAKPNAMPESVTDRVRRTHEQWFHLVKQPSYYSAIDHIREPYIEPAHPQAMNHPSWTNRNHVSAISSDWVGNPLGKLPGSVWTIPSEPFAAPEHLGIGHFAAFPTEWPRRIIQAWSPAGGVVLDPFGGTGTTSLVADVLGRTGISLDLSHDYGRLARWRTTDPRQRAGAMRVDKPEPVMAGQSDLFSEITA
jgi:site-specific DNA-methyltransferase (cytosine-N4-specific)